MPAQVALVWLLGRLAVAAVPKSATPVYVRENRGAVDVELEPGDVARIDRVDRERRSTPTPRREIETEPPAQASGASGVIDAFTALAFVAVFVIAIVVLIALLVVLGVVLESRGHPRSRGHHAGAGPCGEPAAGPADDPPD